MRTPVRLSKNIRAVKPVGHTFASVDIAVQTIAEEK
jgi:hypothetical protein